MICPKCKREIPEKTLKCGYCSAKIATFCKKCHTYNSIYNIKCTKCQNELLKICPKCKAVNFPNAQECRKCSNKFITQEAQYTKIEQQSMAADKIDEVKTEAPQNLEKFDYSIENYSQQMAKEALVKGLLSEDSRIISLSGANGIGKSIVLKTALGELQESKNSWLFGSCSAITQLSPFGLIQDALLTFFNITNFCSDGLKLQKESQRFFHSEFPTLTNEEIFNLLNFLYPTSTDYFENILINKDKTFTFLNKVFQTITEKMNVVFVIDNFELIDGLSYEFIFRFMEENFEKNKLKLILTYNEKRPVRGYFYSDKISEVHYFDISLGNFDKNQMNNFIDQYFAQEKCPQEIKERIFDAAGGNPAILEQYTSLLNDFKVRSGSFKMAVPTLLNKAVEMRLEYLKDNFIAYKILAYASIQGIKFYPALINQALKIDENEFVEALDVLQRLNFIIQMSEHSYVFKNTLIWSNVLEIVKKDENFSTYNEALFEVYSYFTLSSQSVLAVIAQNIDQDLSALNIWTDITKIASYIGDTNLYTIAQKQCLVMVEKLKNINSSLIKNNIYERLGKLLCESAPKEAMEYLPSAILNAKKLEDPLREIELTGYLANCCIKLGDYFGTIECVDSAIEKLDESFELEIAMLKSRKLDALLNIGNCGEIINLIDNEIMPVFERYIGARPHKNISITMLYKAWLQSYLALANALVLQGNNRAFAVVSTLFELFEKNEFDNPLFICKTKLALAFAYTVKGDVSASEEILSEIIKVYKTDIMDNEAISRWNLINILNNFTHKKYAGLKEELFQVVSFANNINDNFTKNILKTLLGKIFKDEENSKRALDIYSEQITYFAKEKNAIGALLTWYLIAQANLVVEGPEKSLEVSLKALDVAQSPKINNYYFVILFNKIIAEAYMAKSDYEAAKINIEKAVMVARKFELLEPLAKLYHLYGKYLQDIALVKSEAQIEYVQNSAKMYKKAQLIAQGVKNNCLYEKIEKSKNVLKSFCQLNGIQLID